MFLQWAQNVQADLFYFHTMNLSQHVKHSIQNDYEPCIVFYEHAIIKMTSWKANYIHIYSIFMYLYSIK